jgi:hypothetical protein
MLLFLCVVAGDWWLVTGEDNAHGRRPVGNNSFQISNLKSQIARQKPLLCQFAIVNLQCPFPGNAISGLCLHQSPATNHLPLFFHQGYTIAPGRRIMNDT